MKKGDIVRLNQEGLEFIYGSKRFRVRGVLKGGNVVSVYNLSHSDRPIKTVEHYHKDFLILADKENAPKRDK